MQHTDRFLLAIVVGAVLLVAGAFLLARRTPPATYGPDDTADGAARNYLLAIDRGDQARAWGYVDPQLPGYPRTLEQFGRDLENCRWCFGRSAASETFTVLPPRGSGDRVTVPLQVTTFHEGGLFGSGESIDTQELILQRRDGAWKVAGGDRYWYHCWNDTRACPSTDQRTGTILMPPKEPERP